MDTNININMYVYIYMHIYSFLNMSIIKYYALALL